MKLSEKTLKDNEPHPAVEIARNFIAKEMLQFNNYLSAKEAIASCAIENNRLAEICLSTIRRVENGEPVSDRYLMGLAWLFYSLKEKKL